MKKRVAVPWRGLQVIDLCTGDIVEWFRFEGDVTKLFDVAIIPGVRCPRGLGYEAMEMADVVLGRGEMRHNAASAVLQSSHLPRANAREVPLPDSPSIRIEVFHSFNEVETTWRKAQEHCACYGFQTFEWLSTWQETIGVAERIEPQVVHIADASENTLMLLPLGIQRRLGLSFVSFLGGVVTDYHAPIVRPDFAAGLDATALNRLIARVLEQLPRVDVIALENMPSVINDVTNPLARLPDAKYVGNAWAAALGSTFTDFKKRRSAKFFSDAARKWRRLSEIGSTKLCIADSPDTATEILRVLVRQKRRRWQEVGSPDLFAKPGYLAFYSTLAERHIITGLIQTSALRVGETLVATHWGMVFRNRFYWLMPTYEAGDWARFSVGRLLMQRLVEWSISQGMKEFDLTIGDEAYKSLWADHTLPLYECIRGLTKKGKVYCEVCLVGRRIKEWAEQREWLRTLVRAWQRHRTSGRLPGRRTVELDPVRGTTGAKTNG